MDNFLLNKSFSEHHCYPKGEIVPEALLPHIPQPMLFRKKKDAICFEIKEDRTLHTSYYIGIDWVNKEKVIYVEPKLNKDSLLQTNYLKMLFDALKHQEVAEHTKELFEIKFNEPYIEIHQQQDTLTPLLIVQFLRIVKEIVRKGIKKSYYRVEQNLHSKVKGKILIGQTIKHNIVKNRLLKNICSYDEFGLNGMENRLLKKTLVFIQHYLPTITSVENLKNEKYITDIFRYITPAFETISDDIDIGDIKHSKTNIFYKEYEEAIRLAKFILKRFGYNIVNTKEHGKIKTPPFWIDMSKLFELYVLGLLKDRFKGINEAKYHHTDFWNELDYLLNTEEYKMVADAKYKTRYQNGLINIDMRQVSGYARLESVYKELGKPYNEVIDCLIFYPDQEEGYDNLKSVNLKDMRNKIPHFVQFYKIPIRLPVI